MKVSLGGSLGAKALKGVMDAVRKNSEILIISVWVEVVIPDLDLISFKFSDSRSNFLTLLSLDLHQYF